MTESHAADPLELTGRVLLERYRIGERIANGGMSVVYRATDERLQRPVCVKVFHGLNPTQSVYQTSYEHFVQEGFALSQLQHPNTIRIYDFGYLTEEPKSPFHVSELLDGGTLLTVVRKQGKLEPIDALDILEPIAQALGEAHARNIIHRDIKPTNILFGMAGKTRVVKLCDFGIAKAYMEADKVEADRIPNRAQDTVAASGRRISLYSPGWAAPEQLRARPCGPPADVYALGLLAAFILTGKKVYNDRDPLETLQKRMEGDEYVADTLLTFDLAPAVRDVLVRACRAKPDDRFQGATEFVAALRIALTKPRIGTQDDDDDTSRIAARDLLKQPGETTAALPLLSSPTPPEIVRPSDIPTMIAGTPTPMPGSLPSNIPTGTDVPLPGPVLALAQLEDTNLVAAGRRVRVLPIADQLDLGGEGDVRSPARVRVTFTPSPTGARVHMRGLNCFLQKAGARLASALDVNGDTDIALLTAARAPLDTIRCTFGFAEGAVRLFPMPNATLAVPLRLAQNLVLFDFGPGRDLVLVHHAQRSR